MTESQRQRRRIFFDLFHRLTDHGSLEGHLVETPAAFVPESLSVILEPSLEEPNTDSALRRPRLGSRVRARIDMSGGRRRRPVVGGAGDTPFRRVVAFDGDGTWSVLVQPHTPGYRLSSDPCSDG